MEAKPRKHLEFDSYVIILFLLNQFRSRLCGLRYFFLRVMEWASLGTGPTHYVSFSNKVPNGKRNNGVIGGDIIIFLKVGTWEVVFFTDY